MSDTLTIAEVAQILRVHPHTVRKYLHSGFLPGVRVGPPPGGQWRIPCDDLEAFLRGKWQQEAGEGGVQESVD